MSDCFKELPSRGQQVVIEQLIDPYDPITAEWLVTFMFVDPDHENLLWFRDEGHLVVIPRDPSEVYSNYGTITLAGLPTLFGFGLGNACRSWRPYTGFAK